MLLYQVRALLSIVAGKRASIASGKSSVIVAGKSAVIVAGKSAEVKRERRDGGSDRKQEWWSGGTHTHYSHTFLLMFK